MSKKLMPLDECGVPDAESKPPAKSARTSTIALLGNPNTGKTTLFNALTGFRRRVANYPGVTVDIGRGPVRGTRRPTELLDLPGTYSLSALSPDEAVVTRVLQGGADGLARPDLILAIADASNLRRNLYLISRLLDVGLPIVVALNMVDVARRHGIAVDAAKLSERLGVRVVPISAIDHRTIRPLIDALDAALDESKIPAASEFAAAGAADSPAADVRSRYAWIDRVLDGVVARPAERVVTWSARIDRVLTHRLGGAAVLVVVLFLVFQAIFVGAQPFMRGMEVAFGWLGGLAARALPDGPLRSLAEDGLIGGVGSVLGFLPQIVILFAAIAVLEDCGYMARAAFMMDRVMRTLGLSGRAFIPLLSSFACAVPAILGTRTIADRRERYVTILIAPFMSCSARLPVYVLLIGAFVPTHTALGGWLPGLVMLAMYLVGVVVAIPLAWLLRKTAFRGPPTGFLLELPGYKRPRLSAIWQRVYLSARSFVVRAGTVILLVNLAVWGLGYFPRSAATQAAIEQRAQQEGWSAEHADAELAGAYLRESYLGRLGRGIEPVLKPIGWDWRVGVAVLASFPAREVVVATLGTVVNLGREEAQEPQALREALRGMRWEGTGAPVFTLPVALALMVFFALCAQCSATLVMIGRETRSWRWPVISFTSMTTIAYFAAWATAAAARGLGL